jgi:hypothetical protein
MSVALNAPILQASQTKTSQSNTFRILRLDGVSESLVTHCTPTLQVSQTKTLESCNCLFGQDSNLTESLKKLFGNSLHSHPPSVSDQDV